MESFTQLLKRIIPVKSLSLLTPPYHFLLAFLAALWYWFPSRGLVVIGVTGTKGKTTTVELIRAVLAAEGCRVASSSSLSFKIGERETTNEMKMTMPGRFFIQRFLYDAVRAGCTHAVIEVTSQGIIQFRHRFIRFSMAVMTNVHPEHIEAHGNFENYIRAKLDLFWRLPKEGIAVINGDDPHRDRFLAATWAHKAIYTKKSITSNGNVWLIENEQADEDGIGFDIVSLRGQYRGHSVPLHSALYGEFNFYNILAACAAGISRHGTLEKIASGVEAVCAIPGRMERVLKDPFQVVVDYAHTPDSLKAVYALLKKPHARLICVLGSTGGGRDKWKRPIFAGIAEEFCNEILLTNEDPYDEDPQEIIDGIVTGFSAHARAAPKNVRTIIDRREAIRTALRLARKGDTVIITGKGAEPWIMGAEGAKIPWDERKCAEEELAKMQQEKTASLKRGRKRRKEQVYPRET
ncbi:MAG: Uncharacterized protein G01um101433_1115 [Parcubacteria group bacterium Gr01-1014_33]|nr:MAG: Uncharacterized protein G01um101433_1115 [Parcubacteria group bacterium Gr01-1014_33]